MGKPAPKYKTGEVRVTVSYGYDIHSVHFAARTLARIRRGEVIQIKGQGFNWDERRAQDFWDFNREAPGALYISTDDGGEIYIGRLDAHEVQVELNGVVLPITNLS